MLFPVFCAQIWLFPQGHFLAVTLLVPRVWPVWTHQQQQLPVLLSRVFVFNLCWMEGKKECLHVLICAFWFCESELLAFVFHLNFHFLGALYVEDLYPYNKKFFKFVVCLFKLTRWILQMVLSFIIKSIFLRFHSLVLCCIFLWFPCCFVFDI